MSKLSIRKKGKKILIVCLPAVVILGGGYAAYRTLGKEQETAATSNYKEETVRRGSVSAGISESGTIEYGTTEQIFSIAEVTEVSVSSSDSSSETSGTTASAQGTGDQAGSASMGSASGISGNSISAQGAAGGQSGSSLTDSISAAGSGMEMSSSPVSGSSESGETTSLEVEEVYVATGQTVSEGDPILKITDESIADYREEMENAVASAKLLVSKEEINVESKRAEADYTYQMYLAEGETAEETYNATVKTLEENVADLEEEIAETDDEDELEELEAELKIAENNLTTGTIEAKQTYENAMTNYKYADQLYEIDTDGLEDDLNDARETLEECEENLEEFESQIGDGIVYAGYSGFVVEVAYGAGDNVINDATVVTYMDQDEVSMTVSVSQDDISSVAVGDTATVYLTAYDGEPFEATVTEVATSSTSGSSTVNYDVTVRITADSSKIYSGMTGEVSIAGKSAEDTLYISNQAVHMDGTRSFVKVLEEDGTIVETDIETGFSNGNTVAVVSGLEKGDTVLIESQVTE